MIVVAVTGGIGAGKSTARCLLEDLGAVGFDADEIARAVVAPGTDGARRVREAFGDGFFGPDGELDRQRMAKRVFNDPEARHALESILHPLIRAEEARRIERIRARDPNALVAVEVPLLAEAGRRGRYDAVILVTAPKGIRIGRAVDSGRYTRPDAEARAKSQTTDEERRKAADYVVENAGSTVELKEKLKAVLLQLGWQTPESKQEP